MKDERADWRPKSACGPEPESGETWIQELKIKNLELKMGGLSSEVRLRPGESFFPPRQNAHPEGEASFRQRTKSGVSVFEGGAFEEVPEGFVEGIHIGVTHGFGEAGGVGQGGFGAEFVEVGVVFLVQFRV